MQRRITPQRILVGSLCSLVLLLFLSAPALWAKTGVVHTTDGKSLEGDISETTDAVTITIHGVQTTLPRASVASIEYPQSIDQAYQERASKIAKNDAAGHLQLARWLLDKKAYNYAEQEVDAAQQIDPSSGEAATLYQVILSQRRLESSGPGASAPAKPANTDVRTTPSPGGNPVTNRKYLSADEINYIKQSEWKDNDTSIRVHLDGDVIKRFTAYASINPADFKKGLTDQQRAWQILTQGLPEMQKDVRIINDPQPLAEYKLKVQPIVINGCATMNCHGGAAAPGGFFLYNPADNEAATYTNFYLLDTYVNKAGKMIDRTFPNRSLITQYALPATATDMNHPEVPKGTAWRGITSGTNDPRFKVLLNWVGESLVAVEPKYNIAFTLPGRAAPPAPAPAAP